MAKSWITDLQRVLAENYTLKFFILFFLVLGLLVPLTMVGSVNSERSSRREEAKTEINRSWGQPQNLAGPVLSIPIQRQERPNGKALTTVSDTLNVLPKVFSASISMVPELRHRGIYQVVVYTAKLTLQGYYLLDEPVMQAMQGWTPRWQEAVLSLGLSDVKGIQPSPSLLWQGKEQVLRPGTLDKNLLAGGFHSRLPLATPSPTQQLPFKLTLSLRGSDTLSILPSGEQATIDMQAPWGNPSFTGAFLPSNRTVTSKSFKADWQISHFSRPLPQVWKGSEKNNLASPEQITWNPSAQNTNPSTSFGQSLFGVSLMQPVDIYRQTERSTKYGALFVVLTLASLFILELSLKVRFHPIQYGLAGLAMCLFYLLLLALSEHVGFAWAYIASSLVVIAMNTTYVASIVPKAKQLMAASTMGLVLLSLYSYLYTVLSLEDYSLLIGTLGLFVALALVMWVSRQVNWYKSEEEA
jgi:inner membrane protein